MTYFPRFIFPWALLLLLLVPWSIYVAARIRSLGFGRKWTAIALRCVILACLVLALAGAEIVRRNDDLAVYFLLDHSDSVTEDARRFAAQTVRNAADTYMTEHDKAGVIVFGRDASIELKADATLGLRDVQSFVDGSQTDLAAAMRLAMAAFPQGHMKRIVVYSDGNETLGSAIEEAKIARAAGVAVDVVPLRNEERPEVRLKEVAAPAQANADEPFQLRITAHADQDGEAVLRVAQRAGEERRLMPEQRVTLQKGDNTFVLSQELKSAGFFEYDVSIESATDTVQANNVGRAYTVVHGEPRILYIEGDPANSVYLEPALRAEGLQVESGTPGSLPSSLGQLQNYDAVVLSDVSSTDLTSDQMHSLEAMVRDLGIGLVMVGGPHSFGAGGFLDTPVEKALPVDMDIKQRKMLPRGALVLVMHTCEFVDGNAWAREIALASLNVLSSQDLMGGLGYTGQGDTWLFPMRPVGDKNYMRQAIRDSSMQIGDMPDTNPSLQMAYDALVNADAAAKRVLLISDGDAAAARGALLGDYKDAGIAISAVCINPHSPSDRHSLERLADATGGQFYFVDDAKNLPQIFTKEAAVVKRGLLVETPFTPQPNNDSELLHGLGETPMPQLQGYVVTSPKENATIALVSHEGDPVLAQWRYGLGKSVAFTSDAANRWAADWLGWEGFNRFWAQAVRWATRELSPSSFHVETGVRDGRGEIRIDAVDPQGKFINFLKPRGVVTGPGPDFARREVELVQTGPGIYETDFPLADAGVYMINLLYDREDGTQGMVPAGLALGYSPEYEFTGTNMPGLEQIAALGGGAIRTPEDNPFRHDLVAAPSVTPIWHWLVIVALCLLPVEVFVRRVVVPFAELYAPVAAMLRRIPGIGRIVPKPAARPVPVTGTYSAARAVERTFEAGPSAPPSLGSTPVAGTPATTEAEAAPAQSKPAAPPSDYTQQLLAAKERAMARKAKRNDDLEN